MKRRRVSWAQIAERYPEFVQWCVASFGPLPDGEVIEEDYERMATAYNRAWLSRHTVEEEQHDPG